MAGYPPQLQLHIDAPALPNTTMIANVYVGGTTSPSLATKHATADGAGHVDIIIQLTPAQMGMDVDITGSFLGATGSVRCQQNYSVTLKSTG